MSPEVSVIAINCETALLTVSGQRNAVIEDFTEEDDYAM